MRNRGFRNPRLAIAVWATVSLVSWLVVAWGILEMTRLGQETGATAAAIGVGLVPAIIAPGMLWLAWKGARLVTATLRGEEVIGRWIVQPAEYAEFLVNNAARNAQGPAYSNDWLPPLEIPAAGLEIIFRADGVMVGDTYFGLVTTGMYKFAGVQMLPESPLAIEFGTVATTMTHVNMIRIHRSRGVLRLPVSRLYRDEAVRVLEHYQRVGLRETIVNPGFYLRRIRWGLMAALICFILAAIGFSIEASPWGDGWETLSVTLAVGGTVAGIGGLVLAVLAWRLRHAQLGKW